MAGGQADEARAIFDDRDSESFREFREERHAGRVLPLASAIMSGFSAAARICAARSTAAGSGCASDGGVWPPGMAGMTCAGCCPTLRAAA